MTGAPNGNGTAKLGVWISALGTGAVVLGALFVLYSQVSTAYATANDLKEQVNKLAQQANDNRVQIAQLEAQQIEVDTQLRASIDDDNKGLAWQLRVNSILWEQAFKGQSHMPSDNAFYPNIANGSSR